MPRKGITKEDLAIRNTMDAFNSKDNSNSSKEEKKGFSAREMEIADRNFEMNNILNQMANNDGNAWQKFLQAQSSGGRNR